MHKSGCDLSGVFSRLIAPPQQAEEDLDHQERCFLWLESEMRQNQEEETKGGNGVSLLDPKICA